MPAAAPRYLGIQIAAAVIFACTVMNLSFFFSFIEDIWAMKHPPLHRALTTRPRVCVLVPVGSGWNSTVLGLVNTVSSDTDYEFSVFVGGVVNELKMDNLSSGNVNILYGGNDTSVFRSMVSSSVCTYYLVIESSTRFNSPGWAATLDHALQHFSPQYLGVATPVECMSCAFVHSVHAEIFSKFHPYPMDNCWAKWVRLSYGQCRSVYVSNSGISSTVGDTCSEDKTSSFSALVTRGRMYISKFLALGMEEFRASRKGGTRGKSSNDGRMEP